MTTRSLSLLVLALVLGTALMVGWYLEGERTTAAAERAPDAQPRVEHVWRSYPGAVSTRRSRGSWGNATSQRTGATLHRDRRATLSGLPFAAGSGVDEATALRSRSSD